MKKSKLVEKIAGRGGFVGNSVFPFYFSAITNDIAPRIFGELDGTNYVLKGKSLTLHCAAAGK